MHTNRLARPIISSKLYRVCVVGACVVMMNNTIFRREIISRETVRPSSPTPPHLRDYKLSLLDQINIRGHICFALFYPFHRSCYPSEQASFGDRVLHLKKSLSEVLTRYYPFAGRFRDVFSIDCNDEGVEFVEARVNCVLSDDILENDPYSTKLISLFFSNDLLETTTDVLLTVQVSILECKGMSIGVSFSHTIGDASSMSNFMNDWAKIGSFPGEEIIPPQFIGSSIFPPLDFDMPQSELETNDNLVAKRFVFDASSIATLKEMAVGSGVQNPTRVELVTAYLLKYAVAATTASSGGCPKETQGILIVNLRSRMIPPLPNNAIGNMCLAASISTMTDEEIEFSKLARKLRVAKEDFSKMEILTSRGEEWFSCLIRTIQGLQCLYKDADQKNLYTVTSWCRFGFYDVDFGWGKAIWIGVTNFKGMKNAIVLTDTNTGDGIEAVVHLKEQEMALFEPDLHLLAPSSSNVL